MKAMVMGAGVGSRLEPLTSFLPKPLVPVANKPIVDHILDLLKMHGINDVISNVHYLANRMVDHLGDGSSFGINLKLVREPELTGDAGGVRACKSFLHDGTFVVLMGDLLTDADLTDVIEQHRSKKAIATIGVKPMDDVSHFGVVVTNSEGFITAFQEKPKPEEAQSNLISTGIYVLEPEIFNHIPEHGTYGFGKQLFPKLVTLGLPVLGVEIKSYWSDIGTVDSYRSANFDALEGRVSLKLPSQRSFQSWIDKGAAISGQTDIDGLLMMGKNSRIDERTKIRGRVVIGDNCHVGPDCELEDCVIWPNVHVDSDAYLKDCVLGFNCLVKGRSGRQPTATAASGK